MLGKDAFPPPQNSTEFSKIYKDIANLTIENYSPNSEL
jgi:hypothetical protein